MVNLIFFTSFASQRGEAQLKSAAMPFSCNSGTVSFTIFLLGSLEFYRVPPVPQVSYGPFVFLRVASGSLGFLNILFS